MKFFLILIIYAFMKITYVIGSGDFRIKYADSSNYRVTKSKSTSSLRIRFLEYVFDRTGFIFDYDKRAYLIYEH